MFLFSPKNEGLQVEKCNFLVLGENIYRKPTHFFLWGVEITEKYSLTSWDWIHKVRT